MSDAMIVLFIGFVAMLAINTPVSVAIAVSSFLAILSTGNHAGYSVAMKIADGVDSFSLLAIPFFILSGILMGRGGIAGRLIAFANAAVGYLPGGLAYVNTLSCMLFGAVSGSASAAVSSIGGFIIPEMNKKGYSREFSVALTATAATTGLLIPPSNIMIVYAVSAGSVSIAAMFMAGVIPGVLCGLSIIAMSCAIALKRGYKAGDHASLRDVLKTFTKALPGLLLIIIVLGGILGGVFTATEAAGIAVAYSLILAIPIYREVRGSDMHEILLQSGRMTAVVMFLIGASSAMSWILTTQNIPQSVAEALLGISQNKLVILMIINVLLLFVGTFMDMTPAVLIFTPIFLPVVQELGMHPVHFGIMMIANLCIGLCTPPVGACLFIGCGIGETSIAKVTPPMLPFFGAMLISLMMTTYIPMISLWLPSVLRLLKN